MAEQLPALDDGSSLWLDEVYKKTKDSKTCPVPPKYFVVLSAWGYVEGTQEAATLTPTAMGLRIQQEQVEKSQKKTTKKSTKKK